MNYIRNVNLKNKRILKKEGTTVGLANGILKADDKKITSMLKKLGDEIKAAPLPPKLKKLVPKLKKAFPHHDSAGKLKKASGGRIGLRHGGSAGAATRGHGAEIK